MYQLLREGNLLYFILLYKALLFICGVPLDVRDYILKTETFGLAQLPVPKKYSIHVVKVNVLHVLLLDQIKNILRV